MAKKRFTDAEKFKDPWYQDLSLIEKVAWEYIICECDHAGIWKINMKLLSFCIGEKFTIDNLKESFSRNVVFIDANHIFIPKFLKFQYGKLSLKSNIHQNVLRRLQDIGITVNELDMSFNCPHGVDSLALPGLQAGARVKEKEKEKEQVKGKDKVKEKEEEERIKSDVLELEKPEVSKHLFDDVVQEFNETLPGIGKIKHYTIASGIDRRNFANLIVEHPKFAKLETWLELFELIKSTPKLLGTHSSFNVVTNLGWLFVEKNIADVLNGKYESESGASGFVGETFEQYQQRTRETNMKMGLA